MLEQMPNQVENSRENEQLPVLSVVIGRHGPKLSAEGEKNAKAAYFDEHVREGFRYMNLDQDQTGLTHIGTSSVQRAEDTAKIYSQELEKSSRRFGQVESSRKEPSILRKEGLTVQYQPAGEASDPRYANDLKTIMDMQVRLKPNLQKKIENDFPSMDPKEKEAELRNQIDMEVLTAMFNDSENISESDKIFEVSHKEVADAFALRYANFFAHIDLLAKQKKSKKSHQPENEPYVQIDVSHSFPIMAFLKEYLIFDDGTKASDLVPEAFFERTGGIIRESGSFKMDFFTNDSKGSQISVVAEFEKGKEFKGSLDIEALLSLRQQKLSKQKNEYEQ